MNFLAGLLLMWMPGEAEAFGGLVVLMQGRNLKLLPCQTPSVAPALQVRLWQFGKLLPPKLADHLEQHGALPVLYVSAWLLTSFSADFPLYFASRVMDVVLSDSVYEGGMKVRCLAAKKFVDRCSVVHCAACRLLLAVTEGPTGHTCGKCHRR
eukprot:jgi/Astpho2/1902/e_gw1.00038.307.1_t